MKTIAAVVIFVNMSIIQSFSKSNLILNDTILEKITFVSRWQNIISYSGDLYLTSNKIIFNSI